MSTSNGRHSMVSAILADNEITSASTPEAERVSGASLVGLWLLIPIALGAVAYALLGIVSMLTAPTDLNAPADLTAEPAAIDPQWWLGLTIALQVIYWVLIAPKRLAGLWAIIPIVSLIATFFIARDALLERSARSSSTADPDSGSGSGSGSDAGPGKDIWIEPGS